MSRLQLFRTEGYWERACSGNEENLKKRVNKLWQLGHCLNCSCFRFGLNKVNVSFFGRVPMRFLNEGKGVFGDIRSVVLQKWSGRFFGLFSAWGGLRAVLQRQFVRPLFHVWRVEKTGDLEVIGTI